MYNKIMESQVLALTEDLGIKAELTENTKGANHYFVLHLQYKDDNGEWQYKGTKGSTSIRVALTKDLANFLLENIKLAWDTQTKFNANKAKVSKTPTIDVTALSKLSDADKQALLTALLGTAPQAPQMAPQATQEQEPVISLGNILLNSKKSNKKK